IFVAGSASFARSAQVAGEAFTETSAPAAAAASVTVGVCISFPPERQYLTAAGARRASHEHCAAPRVGRAPTLCKHPRCIRTPPAVAAAPPRVGANDRAFYTGIAIAAAVVVLVGFSRTEFVRPCFETVPRRIC